MSQTDEPAEPAIRDAVGDFLEAFAPLDSARLAAWMAPEVTAFLPFGPGRIDGRESVAAAFDAFFVILRRQMPGPPYLQLSAEKLHIQWAGSIAVVSFELPHDGTVGRRTLAWQRRPEGWRVIHIHASEYTSTNDT